MALDQTAGSIFGRRKKAATTSTAAKTLYPIQDPDDRIFELVGFTMEKDQDYGKEKFGFMRLKATFTLLADGDPTNADDHDALREGAYGKWFSLEMDPSATPPGVNSRGENYRASNLYELIRHLACFGRQPDPFVHLGIVDENDEKQMDALRAWTKAYNKDKDAEDRITDPNEAMAQYAGATVTKTLNDLEAVEPKLQIKATLDIKVSAKGNEYNKIKAITARLRDKDMLPAYQRLPKPVDPEAANDDPSIMCDVCGSQTHGYRRRDNGEWIDNRKAAEMSKQANGLVACGGCIWKHSASNPDNHGKQVPFEGASKPVAAAVKTGAAKVTAPRNVPQAIEDDDDLPF